MNNILFNVHDMVQVMTAVLCCLFGIVVLVSGKFKPVSAMLLAGFMVAQALIASHELIMYAEQFRYHVLGFSPNLFFIGSFAYLLDGPLIYLYVSSLIYGDFKLSRQHLGHFVPLMAYFIYMMVVFYSQDLAFKHQIIHFFRFDLISHYLPIDALIKASRLFYLGFCLLLIREYRDRLKDTRSDIEAVDLSWLKLLVIGFLVVIFIALLLAIIKLLAIYYYIEISLLVWMGLTGYYLVFLLVILLFFFSAVNISSVERIEKRPKKQLDNQEQLNPEYIERIERIMGEQKPYLIPNINFDSLSEKLDIPPRELSFTLNGHFKMNFYEFINFYRIQEAKLILASKEHLDKTITDIFHHVGFNSKSVFNVFFKKYTGMTPSEFRKQCQREN